MSVQESPRPLKRDRASFEGSVNADLQQKLQVQEEEHKLGSGLRTPVPADSSNRNLSPARCNSSPLSDVGPVTPSAVSDSPIVGTGTGPNSLTSTGSPSAFAALNGQAPPPAKKAKLTFAEKEMKRIQKEIKDQEKAEEKAKKEAEKEAERKRKEAEKEAEKKRKAAEKEADKKRKEAEKEEKKLAQQAEKLAKEEKKRVKEEEKRLIEEEKRKKEEERKKKEGNQATLSSFFALPMKSRRGSTDDKSRGSMSPARQNVEAGVLPTPSANSDATTPNSPQKLPYDKMFPGFFLHKDVKLASTNRFERDDETLNSICQTIDNYLFGDKSPDRKRLFDATSMFHLSALGGRRGKHCTAVRKIMAELPGSADSQNSQTKQKDLLKRVPMKFLKFREDVRPPYRGTYTSTPVHGMAKLGRNPLRRDLPNTNYDYDSEAEWVEDEDAEDCNSDSEEEDDGEDGEDMEGFLDDENDELAHSKRMVIQGDLEPVSSGLCWEDRRRRNMDAKMMLYRMEVIIDSHPKSIDPFSTQYWEPTPANTAMDPPRLPLTVVKPPNGSTATTTTSSSTTKPVTSFFPPTNASSPSQHPPFASAPSSKETKPKKLLPNDDLPKFKEAVEGSNLSKVGLIEVLKKQFPGRPAAAIKGTLETVAKRMGVKEADKRWVIVEGV